MTLDDTIMQQFVSGDKKAFDKVYAAYSAAMYGICLRYTRCREDANDVLQEGFIRVYKSAGTYRPDRSFSAWIKTIFINTSITFIKQNYKFELKEDDRFFDEQISSEALEETNRTELKLKLLQVLNQLPDGYRTVFNLFVIDNLTHKEIADVLGISENTSKTQFFKAKNMIRTMLANETVNA